jgi:cytoskeleton protein RodZ
MTGDREQSEREPEPEDPQGPLGGGRLAEVRRAQQITVLEVAKELHIDESKVRALENNEFDVLGAPVFAKGHLRKYAELVGVDIDDVMADYYQLTRTDGMPPIVSLRPRARKEASPGPWIAAIIILIAAVAAYWWFTGSGVTAPPSTPVVEPEIAAPAATAPAAAEPGSDSVAVSSPATTVPATNANEAANAAAPTERLAAPAVDASPASLREEQEPVTVATTPADSNVDDGQLRLTISYSGDCWTEINDASGRRLFFNMGRDGQTVDLNGIPPISALFGNANNVSLLVDGREYDLPMADAKQTVRLTLSDSP